MWTYYVNANEQIEITDDIRINSNLLAYPSYSAVLYEVNYYDEILLGNGSYSVENGKVVNNAKDVPTKAGYDSKWVYYFNGKIIDVDDNIIPENIFGDIVVKVQYTPIVYNITYIFEDETTQVRTYKIIL